MAGKYFLSTDCDGHWFVVPVVKKEEWNAWTSLGEDDENAWEAPEWAYSVGGSPEQVEFEFPKINGEPVFKKKPPVMIKFSEREPEKDFPCYIIEGDPKGIFHVHVLIPTDRGYRFIGTPEQIRFPLNSPDLAGWVPYE